MARKRARLISQAHEWVEAQGLCDDEGAFDNSLLQTDGQYVPTVATDDPFSGAEATEFYVEATEDNVAAGKALGYCDGMLFPDGSAVWWNSEFWSVTDPHGYDISQEWQLTEGSSNRR